MAEATLTAALIAGNINPRTGLATDYLNHFNNAIMLLEIIPAMPECADELNTWQPVSYRDHFLASHFKARELAVAAYDAAAPDIRERFDQVTGAMTSILVVATQALRDTQLADMRIEVAQEALNYLKPLIARAGAIINGTDPVSDVAAEQADVDSIMSV